MKWFFFLFLSWLNIVESYEYNLVIAAIFKDEAPYFREWIEYHKMMGVEHFRLYNNDSSDDWHSVLAPYIASREVEVVDWPSNENLLKDWCSLVQWPQCQDAIRYFIGKSQWVALIDLDEYLLPLEHSDMITFLENYDEYPAVMLSWQCFGTSYVPRIPENRLLIESLTLKAPEYSSRNFPVKSIVRPEYVDLNSKAWPPHTYKYRSTNPAVFPDKTTREQGPPGELREKDMFSAIRPIKAVINHYVHRDEYYFWNVKLAKKERMEKGVIDELYVFNWCEDCNQIEDTRIFRFVPELRKRIFDDSD